MRPDITHRGRCRATEPPISNVKAHKGTIQFAIGLASAGGCPSILRPKLRAGTAGRPVASDIGIMHAGFMDDRAPSDDAARMLGQYQAVIENLDALAVALYWARRLSGALTCAVIAADALASMALVCFLDGPFGVNALDQRTRHATQNWINAGRSRGEARPLAKLADIGTLLRRATHRSRMLPISTAVAMKVRAFRRRRDLSRSWLGCNAPSPGDVYSDIDAILQLTEAAMLGQRVLWPHPATRERFIALLERAQTRLRRARVASTPSDES